MTYLAVMMADPKDATKIGKVAVFHTKDEANAHLVKHISRYPDAFVAEEPTIPYAQQECVISMTDKTLKYDHAKYLLAQAEQEYARKRKTEYDKLNQYEMMFDDQRDGTTTWVDKINEIKNKHPKE